MKCQFKRLKRLHPISTFLAGLVGSSACTIASEDRPACHGTGSSRIAVDGGIREISRLVFKTD